MNPILRRYTFRLYPNAGQRAQLENLRRMSCRLYNALIEQRRDAWDRRRISLTKFDQGREMTLLARDPDLPEWRSFPCAIRERTAERVDQAYRKYFDNVKAWRRGQWQKPYPPHPPHYQRSAEFSGFGLRECGKGWRFQATDQGSHRIYVQSVGLIKARGRFPFQPAALRTADVMLRGNHWEISIVVKFSDLGPMRGPTRPFSNQAASNSLAKTIDFVRITCGQPVDAAETQGGYYPGLAGAACGQPVDAAETQDRVQQVAGQVACGQPVDAAETQDLQRDPGKLNACGQPVDAGETQDTLRGQGASVTCDKQSDARKPQVGTIRQAPRSMKLPSRGRINAKRRWHKAIARRDHAMHEFTSWLAARDCNLTIERPPLHAASRSARGTVSDPGALVEFKAQMNRDLLDRGIGKFCELLTYKLKDRGFTLTVTERDDHAAMIPELAAQTARLAKQVTRVARRRSRAGDA